MTQFNFFPSDDRIAQMLGVSGQWDALQPYSSYLGYPLWCTVAAVFFVLEMVIPQCRTSWILASAIVTGVIVKLGEVYGWGAFSFGEQVVMFFLLTIAMFCLWLRGPGMGQPASSMDKPEEV